FLLNNFSVCVTVGVNGDQIHQPPLINSPEGDKAVLTCSHDITSYGSMFWYIQHPDQAPELLISEFGESEPGRRIKMDVNRTERLTNLSISDSRTEDTAVYYCAVRPTVAENMCQMVQNLIYSFSDCQ
uniref:Ig-like domain-containing protein n=1 Tax=Paramormyrops kingsleyae TaxID=1676925 RepID=A0A3B3Q2P5_9TELE